MTKRIVLCADDFGQAPAVSGGILSLIQAGRLSATTCLVTSPYWPLHAGWLMPHLARIDLGLHFNLTHGEPVSPSFQATYGPKFPTVSTLLKRAFLRRLNYSVIESECHAQLDRFVSVMGFLPNFIDGHQYVHQFPVIRDAVLAVYEQRLRPHRAYVRLAREKLGFLDLFRDYKRVVINASGAGAMNALLNQQHIPHNDSFSGIYTFSRATNYASYFPRFLDQVEDGGVVVCHPGLDASKTEDRLAEVRYEEYQYLASDQFLKDCDQAGVMLQRFR